MSYDLSFIYFEVNNRLSEKPGLSLSQIADELCCSYSTVEKAVMQHTASSFRKLKNYWLLERACCLVREGNASKEISSELGYSCPENFLRFLKNNSGLTFKELKKQTRHGSAGDLQTPAK